MGLANNKKEMFRQGLYAVIILLPSILTGNIYSAMGQQKSTTALLSSLNALSTSLFASMTQSEDYLDYSLKLLLTHEEFTSFNITGMSKHIGEFLYRQNFLSNAYIVDATGNVVYGINDTILSKVNSHSHVDTALKGTPSTYATFLDNKPFVQLAFPIFGTDATAPPLGAIVFTYDFVPLEERLKALNSSSSNLDGYLVDSNGLIVVSSSNQVTTWQNRTIDINRIRQGLDYDPTTTFTLFDNTPLNGTYFTMKDTDWTLLITSKTPETLQIADLISWFAGLLGVGGISTSEAIRKKIQNNSPKPVIDGTPDTDPLLPPPPTTVASSSTEIDNVPPPPSSTT